jgi:hypothetical protein
MSAVACLLFARFWASNRIASAGSWRPESFHPSPSKCMLMSPPSAASPSLIANYTGFVGDIRLRVSNTRDVSSSVRRNIVAFAPPVLISPVLSIDVRFSAVSIFAIMASAIEAQ